MNFSQMRYFQVVAEEEHISRAAEKLHISQPSLSATIRRLEMELDTDLFERRGRNIYLNEAGTKLLNHINYIFNQMNVLETNLYNKSEELSNKLTIATNNSMFLDNWFVQFIVDNKSVRTSQIIMTEEQMIDSLRNEMIDIALGDFSIIPAGINHYMLVPDEYIIVVPTGHPLAHEDVVYFENICSEPIVALSSNISYRIADRLFAQKGFVPNMIFEGDQKMIFNILLQGRGLLFASRQMIYMKTLFTNNEIFNKDSYKLHMIPIVDLETKYKLSICWKEGRELSALSQKIIHAFINDYPRFIDDEKFLDKRIAHFIL